MQASWVVQVDVTDLVEDTVLSRETSFLKDVSSKEHSFKNSFGASGISDFHPD